MLVATPTIKFGQETPLLIPTITLPLSEPITSLPDPTITPLLTRTSPPTEIPPTEILLRCPETQPIISNNLKTANGVLLKNLIQRQIAILGDEGFNAPFWLSQPDQVISSLPEPSINGQWLAYISYEIATPEKITVHVFNPTTRTEFAQLFNATVTPTLGRLLSWTSNTQIVVLANQRGLGFDWIIWNPFSNETKSFSTNLIDLGETIDKYYIYPVFDPQIEFITYLCEFCGNAEYRVRNIITGKNEWVIDLIPEPPYGYYRMTPVWSPQGELIAVGGHRGNQINGLWVFNRQGQIVYDMAIPTDTFDIAILGLAWSPNGQYLAFQRRFDLPGGHLGAALSYLDIETGKIFDLCQDLSAIRGNLVWSPDSTRLAYFAGMEGSGQRLTIVDIFSGETTQLIDPEGNYILTGWMDINE